MQYYKGWIIRHNPKPIPDRRHDWEATHEDYDGPEDGRHITASRPEELVENIDEYEESHS